MARKLDPSEKYQRKFNRQLITQSKKDGLLGGDCFSKFGVPSAHRLFKEHYDKCVAERNKQRRQEEKEKKLHARVTAAYRKYHWLWKHANEITQDEFKVHARDLGNAIYDLPTLWSGFRTQACIASGDVCEEHFHPRQWAGHTIMSYIFHNNGITMETLRKFFDVFRQVHHTTTLENQKLRKVQKTLEFSGWQESYNMICSPLVQVEDEGPVLTIDEIWDVQLINN